jgi:hypothetical protein
METSAGFAIQRKLLAIAYIAGPFLLLLSALAFALGIGLIPPGISSWVEGFFGSFALILFVPIYLDLSRRLGDSNKTLGTITTITGLFGAAVGFSLEFLRVIEYTLRKAGTGDSIWQAYYANPGWEFLAIALLGPLFPLTSVLLGLGFLRSKTLPQWVAISLLVAGVFFPLAQVLEWEWGYKVTYPLACVLWFAALSFVGVRYLRDNAGSHHPALSMPS